MAREGKLSLDGFELLVKRTLATLPEEFQSYLENVVIMIEDESPNDMQDIMGLYEGVPLVECSVDDTIRPFVTQDPY